jgi:uncharacterized protein YkwD
MFRKTWKQIKILILLLVVIAVIPKSILPLSSQKNKDTKNYLKLNEAEKRLEEYRDDPEALELKLQQLELINNSRKKFKAKPLELDILASRVANKISMEAARNNFSGHYDLAGNTPYHRYAFAGGYDHVVENAFAERSSQDYVRSPEVISGLMREGHQLFMNERAPNDGHKQAVIAPEHTHVGIGYHLEGKQFRYYEEYIDRKFGFGDIPAEVSPGEKFSIQVRTDGMNFLYFMVVYYEDFPKPMTPAEISRRASYPDYTNSKYQTLYAWDLARYRSGPSYRIPLTFSKEGLYYIQLFSDKKEITKPASMSTEGKTPYSGIVIKVKK